MKKSEFKSYIKEEIFEILSEETAQDIEAKTKAQAELNKELEKTKELMKENLNPEVIKAVDRFIKAMAKKYGYSEQDAVFAIMQALKAHSADFQGLNEEEGIPSVYTDKDLNDLLSIVLKYVEDPNDAEKEIERFDTGGFDAMSDYVTANLLRDKDYNDWYNKLHSIKEEEMDDEEMDKAATSAAKKGDSISKIASKLGETTSEMKSLVNKYKKAQEPEKSELMARLKELTKIKKELESLL